MYKRQIEYSAYKDIIFELQIRTTLQHSWAEIEHGLGYKSQYEIPKDIRRRLTRLSASLELLDEEFVHIAKEVDEYNKGIVHIEKILKTDINVNSLIQYVNCLLYTSMYHVKNVVENAIMKKLYKSHTKIRQSMMF